MEKLAQKENKTLCVGALISLCVCVCVLTAHTYMYTYVCVSTPVCLFGIFVCLLCMYNVLCLAFYVSSSVCVNVTVTVLCVCANSYIIRLGRPVNGGVQSLNYASVGAASQPALKFELSLRAFGPTVRQTRSSLAKSLANHFERF